MKKILMIAALFIGVMSCGNAGNHDDKGVGNAPGRINPISMDTMQQPAGSRAITDSTYENKKSKQ